MKLSPTKIHAILASMNGAGLFHANTASTSFNFACAGGLLSRAESENRGHFQTPQYTDESDKKFEVWNDIFFDAVDIHSRLNNVNQYGPILFVFNYNLFHYPLLPEVWITKTNPSKWLDNQAEAERYFINEDEFSKHYTLGQFDRMITLRNSSGYLPFANHLTSILIDQPLVSPSRYSDFENIKHRLIAASQQGGIFDLSTIPIIPRTCPKGCHCFNTYSNISSAKFNTYFEIDNRVHCR